MKESEDHYISLLTEFSEYKRSLKAYRDLKNSLDTAKEDGREEGIVIGREQGRAEGRAEAVVEMARTMKADGLTLQIIFNYTGLSVEEIERL